MSWFTWFGGMRGSRFAISAKSIFATMDISKGSQPN
jgi:hypothetical protein